MPKLTAADEKQLRLRKELADQGYAAWTNENMLDVLDTLDVERARVTELEKGLRELEIRGVKTEYFYTTNGICLTKKLRKGKKGYYESLSVDEFNARIATLVEGKGE